MKTSQALAAAAALCGFAAAKEMAPNPERSAQLYQSGLMHHKIMMHKETFWADRKAEGKFAPTQYRSMAEVTDVVKCVNGVAKLKADDPMYQFKCQGLDLYDFKSHADLGSRTGEGAGSWGWTSPTGREFIAIAQEDGASFSEVSKEGKLIYLGRLPQTPGAAASIWREIKGYKSYVVIGSEATNHGVQFFDMSKLLTVDPTKPVTFAQKDIAFWNGLPTGRSHNVVTNEERNYAVAVGAMPRTAACRSGLIFIDLTDMKNLTSPGCASQDGYVHDAQCLVYRGPDTRYAGKDICYGYNEDTLTIYDVTDKKNTKVISRTSYTGASYTHQGWVLDPMNQEYLVLDDEYDEYDRVGPGAAGFPITYIWDIKDLTKPKQTGLYRSPRTGIDHNQFVHNGLSYQSNYGQGLVIIDVSSIPRDPTGKGVKQVAYFDIYPEDDNVGTGGIVEFVGTWSHYPYFKSGYIVINTIERGAYVVKRSA
ncbi:choice-of-anchor B family protein [Microdochium nivale]|nr:choice-of-anchor B family protein [Microdochium nivale]